MRTIKILSITAQKPFATGSGVYLCELVKGFAKMGHEQAIIFGGDIKDSCECTELSAISYKVSFNSKTLPFPVFGMSDNMPYESSKYRDMDEKQSKKFREEFEQCILKADEEFNPDIVVCHHLYYLTAITANILSHRKVVAICHGTCLRQLKNHSLEDKFIKENINKLYKIFALQNSQVNTIAEIFVVPKEKIIQIGMGYSSEMFYFLEKNSDSKNKLVYAGKLSPSKGVEYLIEAIEKLEQPVELFLAGDGNDIKFIEKIKLRAKEIERVSENKIYFLGRLGQKELGDLFRNSEIFVLPSFYEGLPLVIIEAIACGLKIVYTNMEGSYQWFESNFDKLALSKINMVGVLGDNEKADFDEDEYISNIAEAIEKSRKENYISQTKSLDKLKWDSLCDKIVKEIGEI